MISKSFLKSSFIYSLFGALPLASSVILLPFYTNLLSTKDFGLLALFISFTLLIQVIVNFSFDMLVGIQYYEYKDHLQKLREYTGTANLSLILIGTGFTLFSFAAFPAVFQYLFAGEIDFYPYGLMSVVTAVLNSYFKTYTNLLINQQRPMRFLWMNLFNFFLTIAISITGLYLYPYSLVGPMYGRLLSGAGIFLLSFYYFQHEFGFHFKTKLLAGALAFCAPVALYNVMTWTISYVDRFVINYFNDPSSVAIYDFGVKCTLLIDFIIGGLTAAVNPKIFSIWQSQKIKHSTPEVNKYHHSISAINLLLVAGTILFIPMIVPIVVTNKSYYASFLLLPLLSASFTTRGLLNMYISTLYFFKRTALLPKVFLATAVIQILASFFLVKYFGVWGAAWSLVIVKPIQIFFLALVNRKIFKFSFNPVKLFYLPLGYTMLIMLLSFFTTEQNYYLIALLSFIAVCISIYFVFRKDIIAMLSFFKAKYI